MHNGCDYYALVLSTVCPPPVIVLRIPPPSAENPGSSSPFSPSDDDEDDDDDDDDVDDVVDDAVDHPLVPSEPRTPNARPLPPKVALRLALVPSPTSSLGLCEALLGARAHTDSAVVRLLYVRYVPDPSV